MEKYYVMCSDVIDDATVNFKPVDDVRFIRFDKDFTVAVVRDHTDERLCYCVPLEMVECVEVKD